MMKRSTIAVALIAMLGVVLATASPAAAQTCGPLNNGRVANVVYKGNAIFFDPVIRYEYKRATLTISGPCEDIVRSFDPGEQIFFDLGEITRVLDGEYKWELRFEPAIDPGVRETLESSRGTGEEDAVWWSLWQKGAIPAGPSVDSQGFTVTGGEIIDPGTGEESQKSAAVATKAGSVSPLIATVAESEESGSAASGAKGEASLAPKGTLLTNADGIIRNSLCVGFDCPNSPTFSDTTILLMENNTRIKFDDTSTINAFPRNDWEIEANSNLNGGASYLGFNDCGQSSQGGCASDLVFAVEAGARQNALYVENDGDVGFGTSNPVVRLHTVDGDSPALRLEQDGSSGFAPQTWDIAGNETSFFIRDATNGSTLPFRIRPGAPSSSIDIAADGDVGFSDSTPDDFLDVDISGSNGGLTIESSTDGTLPQLTLIEPTRTWRFRVANNGNFVFTDATAGNSPVQLVGNADTNLLVVGGTNTVSPDSNRVTVNGELFIGTSMVTPDYVFEPDFPLESIEEHADYMRFHKHLPAVAAAQVSGDQHLINVGAQQFGILEELEKAHLYIDHLNQVLKEKDEKIDAVEARTVELVNEKDRKIDDLEARLELVEKALEQR